MFSIRLGDVARVMCGSGANGHSRGSITYWYDRAFDHAKRIQIQQDCPIFLSVSLEAGRWMWFIDSKKALEMLDLAVTKSSNWKSANQGGGRANIQYQEMVEQLDYFRKLIDNPKNVEIAETGLTTRIFARKYS